MSFHCDVCLYARMEHGDRGMGVSHLRYEEEEGECMCTSNIDCLSDNRNRKEVITSTMSLNILMKL